ncbi:MAG: hypothetical protein LBU42_05480, partial [Prevotellaceae bacterium]|nr:hypothetical protein [Prevotellaceae bacterium]
AYGTEPNADKNNAQGGTYTKGGGRGICPKGWHIPTAREWALMLDAVGGDDTFTSLLASNHSQVGNIAGLLKSTEPGYWDPAYCSDALGFSLLPNGYNAHWAGQSFVGFGWSCQLQTSTVTDPYVNTMFESFNTDSVLFSGQQRKNATGLRCIKDL